MTLTVDYEHEDDGRWIAVIVELEGVVAYGETTQKAGLNVEAVARRVLQKTGQSAALKFIHKSSEIETLFQDASRLPATYRTARGSDYDVADSPEGPVGIDSPTNPEDRYE